MLKTWSQINREWFAKGSRPPKASWQALIMQGAVSGKILAGIPYIEEDYLAANTDLSECRDMEMPNLLE